MSEFGARLGWADLPERVHDWAEQVLGARVVRAESQPTGFSPGSADRVETADGRRAFVKAVSSEQNPDSPGLHRREVAVLRSLSQAGLAVAPALLGAYDDGTWVALLTEEVDGGHPQAPWSTAELAATLDALGEIAGHRAPEAWPDLAAELAGEFGCWARLDADPPEHLDPWVTARLDQLHELSRRTVDRLRGDAVAHTDVRVDNLLVQPDGRVRVVDWPWASRGAPWFDAASLLIDVRAVGGVDLAAQLPRIEALGATREDVLGVVAGLGGFLLDAARRPPVPGLPTLRAFQRSRGEAAVALLRELWPD
ncbi:aminoglycoside phosphotransferase family protein [Serinicoccus marinus]|uniref:aminoglycoside phosphotransferase family protein n=1 Tax=Serinicoccus marinus TaxID=247333 RepID=UPI0024925EA7|nr:aminoglycoside phosphotransferase family protein [Serinicoccus marinus]